LKQNKKEKPRTVRGENAKVQTKSIKILEDEIRILENEHKRATEKLKTIRFEVEESKK